MWGWLPVVKLLVAKGADVNCVTITGRTPLMYAIEMRHKYVAKFFAEHYEMELNIPDADGQTPLLIAMELGIDGLEFMEILIDNGADVNMMNFRKKTPLYVFCYTMFFLYFLVLFVDLCLSHSLDLILPACLPACILWHHMAQA
jgi:hypothetical protein